MFKVKDPKQVVLYGECLHKRKKKSFFFFFFFLNTYHIVGFKIAFGGGKSSGFALVYDDVAAAKKYEPRYRLIRAGLAVKKEGSAKQKKEKKNRLKKLRGKEKAAKA
jgi:hypothetical protein